MAFYPPRVYTFIALRCWPADHVLEPILSSWGLPEDAGAQARPEAGSLLYPGDHHLEPYGSRPVFAAAFSGSSQQLHLLQKDPAKTP